MHLARCFGPRPSSSPCAGLCGARCGSSSSWSASRWLPTTATSTAGHPPTGASRSGYWAMRRDPRQLPGRLERGGGSTDRGDPMSDVVYLVTAWDQRTDQDTVVVLDGQAQAEGA